MGGCQKDEKETPKYLQLIKTADQKSPTPPRHFKTQVPGGCGGEVDLVALLVIYTAPFILSFGCVIV